MKIPLEAHESITDDFLTGMKVQEIAATYGCSRTRIYQILRLCGIHAADYTATQEPSALPAFIDRAVKVYPEGDARRLWVERALMRWARLV